jgi:hypothetical protein
MFPFLLSSSWETVLAMMLDVFFFFFRIMMMLDVMQRHRLVVAFGAVAVDTTGHRATAEDDGIALHLVLTAGNTGKRRRRPPRV